MRDKHPKYPCSDGTAGNTCDTGINNRDSRSVSGINRRGLQYITGHKCHRLYMDSTNGLVSYGRRRNYLNNSNNRRLRRKR